MDGIWEMGFDFGDWRLELGRLGLVCFVQNHCFSAVFDLLLVC